MSRYKQYWSLTELVTKLERKSITDPVTKCKLWVGYRNRYGYGVMYTGNGNRKPKFVHRVAWTILRAVPINNILHKCNHRNCWNIDHLYDGTQSDNMIDRWRNDISRTL